VIGEAEPVRPGQVERLLEEVWAEQPLDAGTDVGVLLQALEAGTGRLGRFAGRFFRRLTTSPADYVRLRRCHRRLAAVAAAVEGVIPESPRARAARARRGAVAARILATPVEYRLARGGGVEPDRADPDWASARGAAEVLEDFPAALAEAEAEAEAWRGRLAAECGEAVGQRVWGALVEWREQKREGWAACAGLLARQRQHSLAAQRLRAGSPSGDGGDGEAREAAALDADNSRRQAAAHEERLLAALDAMNRQGPPVWPSLFAPPLSSLFSPNFAKLAVISYPPAIQPSHFLPPPRSTPLDRSPPDNSS
jgi:hypothetical protein